MCANETTTEPYRRRKKAATKHKRNGEFTCGECVRDVAQTATVQCIIKYALVHRHTRDTRFTCKIACREMRGTKNRTHISLSLSALHSPLFSRIFSQSNATQKVVVGGSRDYKTGDDRPHNFSLSNIASSV